MESGNRDLVVIGGSAGALAPLRTILATLPDELPAAVVIVLHVPPSSSGLSLALSGAGRPPIRLAVQAASDGAELRIGKVYIAPPDRHLLIVDGRFALGTGPRENLARPAVDPFFRSAAISHGPRAIGVILSGMMNDGAAGLAAIKRCGGIALVQAPRDAEARDMPIAALEATPVDLSAARGELAEAILRFVSEPPGPARDVPDQLRFEVEIAAGGRLDSAKLSKIADAITMTCPECGGVLSEMKGDGPLRYRCQVGHGFTGRVLMQRQEPMVDEAVRVALRIIEERATLVGRMSRDAAQAGRTGMAEMYDKRAEEYRGHAETLRTAILQSMNLDVPEDPAETMAKAQMLGVATGHDRLGDG